MCIRDRAKAGPCDHRLNVESVTQADVVGRIGGVRTEEVEAVSYTHLRAHETVLDLVCRLLLEQTRHMSPIRDVSVTYKTTLRSTHYHA